MPTDRTIKAYRFEELDDTAKEHARAWWRECENQDFDTDYVIEDAQRMGAIMGIILDVRPVKLMNGSSRLDPIVYWSGFSSQGDGACFEGRYHYVKGAAKAIRKEAPTDKRLHSIADQLQSAQRGAFYRLEAKCQHRGHYYHSGCMQVDVWDRENEYSTNVDESAVTEALREFADWIYRQLEAEYEYRMSDENVDESIIANQYDFTKDGRRSVAL